MSEFKDPESKQVPKGKLKSFLKQYPWNGEKNKGLAHHFKAHANDQCALLVLPILLISFMLWLPYLEQDQQFHARPWLSFWTRVAPTCINSVFFIAYISSRKVRSAGTVMLTMTSANLVWFEVITMVSSNFNPGYISSLYLGLLFPVVLPLPLFHVWFVIGTALAMVATSFFLRESLGLHMEKENIHSLMDLGYAYFFSFLIPYLNHRLRRDFYDQSVKNNQQKLKLDVLLAEKSQLAESTLTQWKDSAALAERRLIQLTTSQEALKTITLRTQQEALDLENKILDHLHDTIGQNLALNRLRLSELLNSTPEDQNTQTEIKKVLLGLDQAIADSRQAMSDFYLKMLNELGFLESLKEVIQESKINHQQDIAFSFDTDISLNAESPCLLILKGTQELLHNCFKHARRSKVFVSLRERNQSVVLTVRDQGKGFDESHVRPDQHQGFGLFKLRTMAESMDGQLLIQKEEEGGAAVRLVVPC